MSIETASQASIDPASGSFHPQSTPAMASGVETGAHISAVLELGRAVNLALASQI
jgi:hypothetical protein